MHHDRLNNVSDRNMFKYEQFGILKFYSQPCKTIRCEESIRLLKEHCFHSFHPVLFCKQAGLVNSQSKQVSVPSRHCFNGPYYTLTYNKKAVSDFKDICSLKLNVHPLAN